MSQNYGSVEIKKTVNKSSNKMLKHLIHHFATNNEGKADSVKQFNSTLKSRVQNPQLFLLHGCVSSIFVPELTATLIEMYTAALRITTTSYSQKVWETMGSWVFSCFNKRGALSS